MKKLPSPFAFFLFLLVIIRPTTAAEYNLTCVFTPKIQLVNISLNLFGLGYYFPELVENNWASYSVKLKAIGNWSEYQNAIQHRTIIQCDG
jgi:hypothetical protein